MRFACLLLLSVTTAVGQQKVGNPSFLSPHARPIVAHDAMVYVVNTPADTVDVINRKTRKVVGRVAVGVLIAQDLAVVPMLLLVDGLAGDGGLPKEAIGKVLLAYTGLPSAGAEWRFLTILDVTAKLQ